MTDINLEYLQYLLPVMVRYDTQVLWAHLGHVLFLDIPLSTLSHYICWLHTCADLHHSVKFYT